VGFVIGIVGKREQRRDRLFGTKHGDVTKPSDTKNPL
jgi:hypothetical protein